MTDISSHQRRSIALVGLRGSGKTIVGRELARLLTGDHVDTDELIVAQAGQSIAAIFREQGEPHFRNLERETIGKLVSNPPRIISVGGGAVLDPANVTALRHVAQIVWLTAPPSILWQRVENDPRTAADRPPLTTCGGRAGIAQLLIQREPLYRAAADFVVDTLDKWPETVAGEIIRLLNL